MSKHDNDKAVFLLQMECRKRGLIATGSLKLLAQRICKHEDNKKQKAKSKNKNSSARVGTKDSPLRMTAQQYVDKFCGGDFTKALPQWIQTASGKVALKIPDMRGSKVGSTLRWVKYNC